jgi:hypothetical protein
MQNVVGVRMVRMPEFSEFAILIVFYLDIKTFIKNELVLKFG